jgi:hypothetical protein
MKLGKHIMIAATAIGLILPLASHAMDPAYAEKLKKSGCTQVTELQGCDINKSKAENAKAGFGVAPDSSTRSAYAGRWVATSSDGRIVATIHGNKMNMVKVNGEPVASEMNGKALAFKMGTITFNILADPRLPNEDTWFDSDAQTTGPIRRQ